MRIIGFDYLRGIAILMIVAGHALGTWQIDTIWEKTIVNLVSGGTVLFVFISGFFFHHIFYTQFRLTSFLSKKIQNVFLPYLLLSTLGFTYFALSSAPFPFLEYFLPEGIQNGQDYFTAYFSYLWTGRIMWAYWYIPFIMLIFILSPVFISYIKLPMIFRLSIMVSLLLVSAFFIHRPVLGLSPIHSLLYFIPVYLLGINCSVNRLQFETLINGKLGILATLVVSLAILQSLYFDSSGSAYKETWFSLAEFDINLLQKVLMCFFFVGLLQQLETKSIPVLKHLANTSFAIYFLHTWVLHITDHYPIFDLFPAIPQVFIWLIMTCSVIIVCMTVAFLIKKVMGNHSRQLIGW